MAPLPPFVTSWHSGGANGRTWSVTTQCNCDDSDIECIRECEAAHNQAVAVLLLLHPKDP